MSRIVVSGYMIRHPVAGNILAYIQYVLGLHRLGHDVVYIEESGWPYSCYDPTDRQWHAYPTAGLPIVRGLCRDLGADVPVIYVDRESGRVDGADASDVAEILRRADLLLNVGGVCWLDEFELCGCRALVDLDPMFTQANMFGAKLLDQYHAHFSYGANIGREACTIPTGGVDWLPTVPPVVVDIWPWAMPADDAPMTTIANWSAYGALEYEGRRYGQKDVEFLKIIDLPARVSRTLELAISGADETTWSRLRAAGWQLRDAGEEVSSDIATYQSYIRGSRGELSAAKEAYVRTRSGWFSDRSACYLASGLPVVVQDTGFTDWLPAGDGVIPFTTLDEAAAAIERVESGYEQQRKSARAIAEGVFSHTAVLPRMIELALERRPEKAGGMR
jgi:hypothetical protein